MASGLVPKIGMTLIRCGFAIQSFPPQFPLDFVEIASNNLAQPEPNRKEFASQFVASVEKRPNEKHSKGLTGVAP